MNNFVFMFSIGECGVTPLEDVVHTPLARHTVCRVQLLQGKQAGGQSLSGPHSAGKACGT